MFVSLLKVSSVLCKAVNWVLRAESVEVTEKTCDCPRFSLKRPRLQLVDRLAQESDRGLAALVIGESEAIHVPYALAGRFSSGRQSYPQFRAEKRVGSGWRGHTDRKGSAYHGGNPDRKSVGEGK